MKERKGKAKNVGAKVITIGGIFGKTMNCEKDLPSSRDGGVGPMNTGLVAREVFLQHLPWVDIRGIKGRRPETGGGEVFFVCH